MNGLTWDRVCSEFAFDGGWRDIYVLGTDMTAWQRMLDKLRATDYELTYLRDEQPTVLPYDAIEAFPLPGEDRLLQVRFGGVLANCHFFTSEQIEFDIDPREVTGQEQLDAVIGFMRCLAEAVGK